MISKLEHPLEMLSTEEISLAYEIYKTSEGYDEATHFSQISLVEPTKEFLKDFKPGDPFEREVKLIGRDSALDGGFVATINLSNKTLNVDRVSNSAQVQYTVQDIFTAMTLLKEHPDYQAAMKKRGITDMEKVQIDPWPAGGIVHENIKQGHRALKGISFFKEDAGDNPYAKPINGVIGHVDLTLGEVVCVEDHGVDPIPEAKSNYDAASQAILRDEPKEIKITQPDGVGFSVDRNKISWEGWDVRVSLTPDEGVVLHELSLNDRPILFRAAMSDMVVPYGSADPMHSWKAVHDGTEYGFGRLSNSLTLGCDCLGEIHYFNSSGISFDGSVEVIENAICLHEEDYGIQWKHNDGMGAPNEVRRSRRLVISSISTIGNYDYGLFWYLYLDGTIEAEVKLTGIVGISAYNEDKHNPNQDLRISKELVSPVHQHLFCMRLDWNLDGGNNQLFESEIELMPEDENNLNGMQFQSVSTHLKTEHEAKRDISPATSRVWKVVNPQKKNGMGLPVAYKLLPGNTPKMLARDDSPPAKRASFGKHNLWGTPFNDGEYAAGGANSVMHSGEGGLDDITSGDRDISNCDLVTWYTFGVTHVPRPEDWPVMPVEYCGFHLIPVGFFDENPTINLPPKCSDKSDN